LDDAPPLNFEGENGEEVELDDPAPPSLDPDKPHKLPADWEAPVISDLPAEPRALVEQWPDGAYQQYAAGFRDHWRDVDPKKRTTRGWNATLANWLRRVHPEVMRAGKAGVSFKIAARSAPGSQAAPTAPVEARRREDERSRAIHARLRDALGEQMYALWINVCAILIDKVNVNPATGWAGLTVIGPSRFMVDWIDGNLRQQIIQAAEAVTGSQPRWVSYIVETKKPQPDIGRAGNHGQGKSQAAKGQY
jgi:hypothetical protein